MSDCGIWMVVLLETITSLTFSHWAEDTDSFNILRAKIVWGGRQFISHTFKRSPLTETLVPALSRKWAARDNQLVRCIYGYWKTYHRPRVWKKAALVPRNLDCSSDTSRQLQDCKWPPQTAKRHSGWSLWVRSGLDSSNESFSKIKSIKIQVDNQNRTMFKTLSSICRYHIVGEELASSKCLNQRLIKAYLEV